MHAELVAFDESTGDSARRHVVGGSEALRGWRGDLDDRHDGAVPEGRRRVVRALHRGEMLGVAVPHEQLGMPVDLPHLRGRTHGGSHLVTLDEESVGRGESPRVVAAIDKQYRIVSRSRNAPTAWAAAARSRSRICDVESHRIMQEVTPSRYRSSSSLAGVSGARSEATGPVELRGRGP